MSRSSDENSASYDASKRFIEYLVEHTAPDIMFKGLSVSDYLAGFSDMEATDARSVSGVDSLAVMNAMFFDAFAIGDTDNDLVRSWSSLLRYYLWEKASDDIEGCSTLEDLERNSFIYFFNQLSVEVFSQGSIEDRQKNAVIQRVSLLDVSTVSDNADNNEQLSLHLIENLKSLAKISFEINEVHSVFSEDSNPGIYSLIEFTKKAFIERYSAGDVEDSSLEEKIKRRSQTILTNSFMLPIIVLANEALVNNDVVLLAEIEASAQDLIELTQKFTLMEGLLNELGSILFYPREVDNLSGDLEIRELVVRHCEENPQYIRDIFSRLLKDVSENEPNIFLDSKSLNDMKSDVLKVSKIFTSALSEVLSKYYEISSSYEKKSPILKYLDYWVMFLSANIEVYSVEDGDFDMAGMSWDNCIAVTRGIGGALKHLEGILDSH